MNLATATIQWERYLHGYGGKVFTSEAARSTWLGQDGKSRSRVQTRTGKGLRLNKTVLEDKRLVLMDGLYEIKREQPIEDAQDSEEPVSTHTASLASLDPCQCTSCEQCRRSSMSSSPEAGGPCKRPKFLGLWTHRCWECTLQMPRDACRDVVGGVIFGGFVTKTSHCEILHQVEKIEPKTDRLMTSGNLSEEIRQESKATHHALWRCFTYRLLDTIEKETQYEPRCDKDTGRPRYILLRRKESDEWTFEHFDWWCQRRKDGNVGLGVRLEPSLSAGTLNAVAKVQA